MKLVEAMLEKVAADNGGTNALIASAIGAGVGGLGGYALTSEKGTQESDREYRNRTLKNALLGAGLVGAGAGGIAYGANSMSKNPIGVPTTVEGEAVDKYAPYVAGSAALGAAGYGGLSAAKKFNANNYNNLKSFLNKGHDAKATFNAIAEAAKGGTGYDSVVRGAIRNADKLNAEELKSIVKMTGGSVENLSRALGQAALKGGRVSDVGSWAKAVNGVTNVVKSKPGKVIGKGGLYAAGTAGVLYGLAKMLGINVTGVTPPPSDINNNG